MMAKRTLRYALIAAAALMVVVAVVIVQAAYPSTRDMLVLYELLGIAIAALGAATWKLVEG